jgi:hypothetical protein
MSNEMMSFTKIDSRTYVSGRWSIIRTNSWELRLDGIAVQGYRSLDIAKAGASYNASRTDLAKLDAYLATVTA